MKKIHIVKKEGEDPRVKDKGFEPEKGSYRKSAESVGELYPVLKDEYGIIDGFHRKDDKPDWHEKEVKSENLKEHYKKMLHANFQRRIVPEEQMKEWINGIAEELEKEGIKENFAEKIIEELNDIIEKTTVYKYLDESFKRSYQKSVSGKVTTEEAEKEAKEEIKQELKTSDDYKKASKALKKKAKKLETEKEKEELKKKRREEKQRERAKKLEREKQLKEEATRKLIENPSKEVKDAVIDKFTSEELEKKAKEKREQKEKKKKIKVRYINPSGVEWCDYGINIYKGCSHNCTYCYAKLMFNRKTLWENDIEAWNKPIKREIDLGVLKEELGKLEKGRIFFCSVTDAYQPINKKLNWAREVLKVLLESKHTIIILTKNASVEDDFDLIRKYKNVEVGFTITTLNDEESKKYESNSSLPSERIRVLKKAHMMGITTRVSLEPWIPNFTNPFEIVKELYKYVDYWWVGIYNYAEVKFEWYQEHVGKLQSLFMELGCKYWFKAELDRIFKSNPILSREEYQKADAQMVGNR